MTIGLCEDCGKATTEITARFCDACPSPSSDILGEKRKAFDDRLLSGEVVELKVRVRKRIDKPLSPNEVRFETEIDGKSMFKSYLCDDLYKNNFIGMMLDCYARTTQGD